MVCNKIPSHLAKAIKTKSLLFDGQLKSHNRDTVTTNTRPLICIVLILFKASFPYDRSDRPNRSSRFETIETFAGFRMIVSIAWKDRKRAVVGSGPGYDNTILARYSITKMEEFNLRVNFVTCQMLVGDEAGVVFVIVIILSSYSKTFSNLSASSWQINRSSIKSFFSFEICGIRIMLSGIVPPKSSESVSIWSLQILIDCFNRSDRTQFYPSDRDCPDIITDRLGSVSIKSYLSRHYFTRLRKPNITTRHI